MIPLDTKENIPKERVAIPLSIHEVGRSLDEKDPIPKKDLVSEDKLLAGRALEEVKIDLGWVFNTRNLTLSLPIHKYTA